MRHGLRGINGRGCVRAPSSALSAASKSASRKKTQSSAFSIVKYQRLIISVGAGRTASRHRAITTSSAPADAGLTVSSTLSVTGLRKKPLLPRAAFVSIGNRAGGQAAASGGLINLSEAAGGVTPHVTVPAGSGGRRRSCHLSSAWIARAAAAAITAMSWIGADRYPALRWNCRFDDRAFVQQPQPNRARA